MENNSCEHFDQISPAIKHETPETTKGCFECLKIGGVWVNLRQCLSCGVVHCCDSSPDKHATNHFNQTGHPIIHLLENQMKWCYPDELVFQD